LSRKFLLGQNTSDDQQPTHPLLGIRFIHLENGIEFIGEITSIFDGVATIENPMLITKDKNVPGRLELKKFNTINPLVRDEMQVPTVCMTFSFKPADMVIQNYVAARSGLVSAQSVSHQPV
jgi:hypothetical protein